MYRELAVLNTEKKKYNYIDKLLGRFKFYRKFHGGHWERLHLDAVFSNTSKSTKWLPQKQCNLGKNEMVDMCLECEGLVK